MALYAFDTEFMQDGSGTIDLISIGIAASDGRTYYAESLDFDPTKANDFVKEQVLPKLGPIKGRKSRAKIRDEIKNFIGDDRAPVFIAYYAAHDWVMFTELFGSFGNLPGRWPKLCWDLKCLQLQAGAAQMLPDPEGAHNALTDALWVRECTAFLMEHYGISIPGYQPGPAKPAAEEQATPPRSVWALFGQIKEQVLGQPVQLSGSRALAEAIGDNTVDNLIDELTRATSIELGQFVVGLLNVNVDNFSFAYNLPQHIGFKHALDAIVSRYRVMDGSEQGDVFSKVKIMFKDILVARYPDLGPDAAEITALKYANQMIGFLKSQALSAADFSFDYTGKTY